MMGKITFYNRAKGFGFITCEGTQYFFHFSNFKGIDNEPEILGAFVHFLIGDPIALGKKPQAIKIRFATMQDVAPVGLEAVVKAGA